MQEPNQSNKKRISLAKYIISILIVAILASGTTMFIYESKHSSGTLGLGSGDADLSELTYLNQLIQSQYIKEVDQQDLIDGAMKGMIGAMGDPYSDYFVPVEAKDFDDSVAGSFEGIGAVMKIENDTSLSICILCVVELRYVSFMIPITLYIVAFFYSFQLFFCHFRF